MGQVWGKGLQKTALNILRKWMWNVALPDEECEGLGITRFKEPKISSRILDISLSC